jgi:hypothetical protein
LVLGEWFGPDAEGCGSHEVNHEGLVGQVKSVAVAQGAGYLEGFSIDPGAIQRAQILDPDGTFLCREAAVLPRDGWVVEADGAVAGASQDTGEGGEDDGGRIVATTVG